MTATVYVVCLVVGGGLLLVSTIFAGHSDGDMGLDGQPSADAAFDTSADVGHDVATDAGHDVSHGHTYGGHGHGFSLATWFSVQFVVYFLAVFGLVGTTLTYGSRLSANGILLAAGLAALVVGQGVHQLLRLLKRTGVGSEVSSEDFLNKLGRVTIAIQPARYGEIAVSLHSGERFVSAAAKRPDDRFRVGDRVVVSSFRNGVAEVVSREEFEFVSDSKTGE